MQMPRSNARQRKSVRAEGGQEVDREPEYLYALPASLHDAQTKSHGANFQRFDRLFDGFGRGSADRFNARQSAI